MADLPLLVFPQAKTIPPPKGNGFPPSTPHVPTHAQQIGRLAPQLSALQQEFSRFKASISGAVAGLEPEAVLVIEIAGSVEAFKRAVDATAGLEWLGEWDIEDIAPDDYFYEVNNKKEKTEKRLTGRLFLALCNEQGLRELLSLWEKWKEDKKLPSGKTKWRDVFNHLHNIRRWGIEETLGEARMIERWQDLLDPVNPAQKIHCQIELFYRWNAEKRRQNERIITALLMEIGGRTLSTFKDKEEIAFHAVKALLPADKVRHLLDTLNSQNPELDIQLFQFPGVMYFRPTGQSLVTSEENTGETVEFPTGSPELPPIAAILDGVPNLLHEALKDRLDFDDPDNLGTEYQPGEKRHGTAMASLVVHGELDGSPMSLPRRVYHLAVMQPNPKARKFGKYEEHFPDDVFFEDRIERAVLRMLKGEGTVPAQAPGVKIINLSIGDQERPFIHTPSPWARLLDWLSWKCRVLFCVSAGNCGSLIDVGITHSQFSVLTDDEKIAHTLKNIEQQLSERRLLSPAESINALTVGSLHSDESGDYTPGQRIDLLPNSALFSPISRIGHGFRRSVKPEILFPGGRQLYKPCLTSTQQYRIDEFPVAPGQKVAYDSSVQGDLNKTVYQRGTSNATALATRSGARIYEVLAQLQENHGQQIRDDLMAVLIKTLLVHGAQHPDQAKEHLTQALKNGNNSRRFKEVIARYMGYGAVNIERVLACTEQRGTVLGCAEIKENEVHEYRFPLPVGLSSTKVWRRMVVTLAWFSPINSAHRNLREAKLELSPPVNWKDLPLKLERQDADHNQVLRGTVQHEILESESKITAFQDGDDILLHVICKKDATEKLDDKIPYGLAVTLEVAEGVNIPIYQQIRAGIRTQIIVGASVENL